MILKFKQSYDIRLYKSILDEMTDEFEYEHYPYILSWCLKDRDINKYWEVWLIKYKRETIGITGLYSLYENNNEELWGGWGGFIPRYRNKGLGKQIDNFKVNEAKKVGCKRLFTYVGENSKALNYFYRQGYNRLCSVQEYLLTKPELKDQLGSPNDHIIMKEI